MLNKKLVNTLVLAALATPALAMAEDAPASPHTVTANVALVTDYLYRGISQTNAKPALQGGFDYAHTSGFYAGVWGSSISWLADATYFVLSPGQINSSLELDTYFGFKSGFAEDATFDIGFLRYNYPGTYPAGFVKPDTNEIYGALAYKFLSAKVSYSLGDLFGVSNARGSTYVDLSANYPVADTGVTLGAHIGKQTYKGTTADALAIAGNSATYTDYKLSVSKDFSGFVLGLAYSSTNASPFYTNAFGKKLGKGIAVLSLSRAF